ncbi:MAG: hypothetical protein WC521_04505 [Bdellovibrionales bacterium]
MKKILFFVSALGLIGILALPLTQALANSPAAGHREFSACKGLLCLGGLLQGPGPLMNGTEKDNGFGGLNCNSSPNNMATNIIPHSYFRLCGYVCCRPFCALPLCWSPGKTASCRHDYLVSECTGAEHAWEDDDTLPHSPPSNPGEGPANWPDKIAFQSCLGPTKCEMKWTGRTGVGHTGWGCPNTLNEYQFCKFEPPPVMPPTICPKEATKPCDQGFDSNGANNFGGGSGFGGGGASGGGR